MSLYEAKIYSHHRSEVDDKSISTVDLSLLLDC